MSISKEILKGCSLYCAGSMENEDGRAWRDYVAETLEPLGITCFNPYKKPFLTAELEDENTRKTLKQWRERGDFDRLSQHMKNIKDCDLNLVERSDLIVAKIDPIIASYGTSHELFHAAYLNKPTFIVVNGGKQYTPLWLFGVFSHKYFYDSLEAVLSTIRDIDNGSKEIDSDRWRLLKPEHRTIKA